MVVCLAVEAGNGSCSWLHALAHLWVLDQRHVQVWPQGLALCLHTAVEDSLMCAELQGSGLVACTCVSMGGGVKSMQEHSCKDLGQL